ncbi:MAG: hypothetical protein ACLU5J_12775 [Christensenellales bacterium]
MSTLLIKVNDQSVLTFDLNQQEIILNYQNNLKASELNNQDTAGLCNSAQCYNCNQKQCNQVKCSNIECTQVQCTQVHCNQVQCNQVQCNECTYCLNENACQCDCNDGN